jgi:hypothetical protein
MTPDPTNHDGKHDGKFFEEFGERLSGGGVKFHGVRVVESANGRKLGADGEKEMTLTADTELLRNFRTVILKASVKKPRVVFTTMQKLGRK